MCAHQIAWTKQNKKMSNDSVMQKKEQEIVQSNVQLMDKKTSARNIGHKL